MLLRARGLQAEMAPPWLTYCVIGFMVAVLVAIVVGIVLLEWCAKRRGWDKPK